MPLNQEYRTEAQVNGQIYNILNTDGYATKEELDARIAEMQAIDDAIEANTIEVNESETNAETAAIDAAAFAAQTALDRIATGEDRIATAQDRAVATTKAGEAAASATATETSNQESLENKNASDTSATNAATSEANALTQANRAKDEADRAEIAVSMGVPNGGPISTGSSPEAGTTNRVYFPTASGTYTNFGGLVVDITTGLNIILGNSTSGFQKLVVPIDLDGYATSLELDDISEAVETYNLFDKTNIINNEYVSTSNGVILAATNWSTSNIINVTAGLPYTLSGLPSKSGKAIRWEDNSGALISFNSFSTVANNDPVTYTAPTGATKAIFTIRRSTDPANYDLIQFEQSAFVSTYQPFGFIRNIKESSLPENEYVNGSFEVNLDQSVEASNYVSCIINGKELKQGIKPFRGVNLPFDTSITTYDGVVIRETTDDAAPYRIDGGTIGGNHSLGTFNLNKEFKVFIDGKEISNYNKTYYPSSSFCYTETYNINGRFGQGIVANVSITYDFNKYGGCTVYSDIYGVQDVPLQDIMFVMGVSLTGNYSMLIPKTLPFSHESVSYDFSNPTDMSSFSITNRIDITPSRAVNDGIFADRAVVFNENVGFSIGYLPVQSSEIAIRRTLATRKALQISQIPTTEKIYMSCIDSEVINELSQGDYYSVIAYKNYFVKQKNSTSLYWVSTNGSYYLYLDYHVAASDRIFLIPEVSGLEMELIEKSESISFPSLGQGTLLVNSSGKGYGILKFS